MIKKLPMFTAILCLGYLAIILIALICGSELCGYMLAAAISFPWFVLVSSLIKSESGYILFLLFFANGLMLVLIAALVGAVYDFLKTRTQREMAKKLPKVTAIFLFGLPGRHANVWHPRKGPGRVYAGSSSSFPVGVFTASF